MKAPAKFVFAALFLIGVGYAGGYLHGHRNVIFESGFRPKLVNTELRKPKEVDFSLFWDAYDILNSKHIKDLDPVQGTYGAISGLVQSLKDPFSAFLDPTEARLFTQDLQGQFGGIGAELSYNDNRLTIISPIEGTPAARAGLKPKDEIIKINGEEVAQLTFGEAIEKIRGNRGTKVTLTIVRQNVEKSFDVTITREIISVKSVIFTDQGDVGILRITQFNEDTLAAIKKLEPTITSRGGIVIDLRNNPGGLLQSAIDIVSLFDEKSPVVIEEEKDGQRRQFDTTEKPILKDVKAVVLINEGSASASEIFAGALQDHGRAKVVGVKSFGKGSVQNLESLRDGSLVRLTVALWLTPNGRKINGTGIQPDVEVAAANGEQDVQLTKALELLAQ